MKGLDTAVDAFRLLETLQKPGAGAELRSLVGADRELALLRQAFDRAAVDGTCQLATVLGVAGMGKTRVTDEFLDRVGGEATVLRARCLSYGEGVTYWPLVEAVRQAAHLDGAETEELARDRVAARMGGSDDAREVVAKLAAAAGLGGQPATADDTSWAFRRLLTEISRKRPVVLVVEDLHWAEAGLVSLLEDVCTWVRDAPVLLLVNARPEFLDDNPAWGAGQVNGVTALLEPLASDELAVLTVQILDGPLPADVSTWLREQSGGNPLYVEHMLAVLVEEGLLRQSGGVWTTAGDVTRLPIPPTISAVIAARLDRLPAHERATLGVAAVAGQTFYRDAVAELSPDGTDVTATFGALLRKGLVVPAESDLVGQRALRFSHVLVREAAYAALPKAVRAGLHEQFARWLDRSASGRAVDDFVGGHLESAYLARADLGDLSEPTHSLGREAAARLGAAARTLAFVDDEGAAALLERADRLVPEEGPLRWQLRLDLAHMGLNGGPRLAAGRRLALSVRNAARASGDDRWATMAELILGRAQQEASPEGATEELRTIAEAALRTYAEDDELCLMAHAALSDVASMRADSISAVREMRAAAVHARRAERSGWAEMLELAGTGLMIEGPLPLEECMAAASRRWRTATARVDQAVGAAHTGAIAAMVGDLGLQREAFAFADELATEMKLPVFLGISRWYATSVLGHWSAAAAAVEDAIRDLRRGGRVSQVSPRRLPFWPFSGCTSVRSRLPAPRWRGPWRRHPPTTC